MKRELIFLTIFLLCFSWALLQAQSPENEGDEVVQHEKNMSIGKLMVVYFQTKEGRIIPANVSEDHSVAYLWKGVLLRTDQIPRYEQMGSYGISPFNMPELQKKLTLKETQPTLKYLLTKEQPYRAGYFDHIRKIFYSWNLEYDRDQLPKDAEKNGLIVKDTLLQMAFSTIDPPSQKSHDLERLQKDYDVSLEKRRIASISEREIAIKKFGTQPVPPASPLPPEPVKAAPQPAAPSPAVPAQPSGEPKVQQPGGA